MNPETGLRIAFFALLAGVLGMRITFVILVRQAGERVLPDRRAVQREGTWIFAARVVVFLLLIAFLVLFAVYPPWMAVFRVPLPTWLRWIGFALGLVSIAFGVWAQGVLGKEWSPQLQLREEHRLVTTGPYAWIRHPIYSALLIYGVSLALVSANWILFGQVAVIVAGLIDRIPKEERMLIEQFGEEYRAYMQTTGGLFPRWGAARVRPHRMG